MDISVVEGAGHLVVRAQGLLGVRTAPVLRQALLKAAAEQPRGIVCDLTDVRAVREALTVLHVVADQVADWPSSPLALVATAPPLLGQLDRLGLRLRLPVAADVATAAAALRRAPRLLLASTVLPGTVDAPAAARAFAVRTLTRWGAEQASEPAQWVVSELTANAAVHAGTEVTVRVSLAGRRVGIAVADRGPGGTLRPGARGGWGLRAVDQLSRSWGTMPRSGAGHVVWAVLDADVPARAVVPQQQRVEDL